MIRESWVRTMEAQLVREKLDRCYQTEGVNHLESCKYIRERYLDMLKDNRVRQVLAYLVDIPRSTSV